MPLIAYISRLKVNYCLLYLNLVQILENLGIFVGRQLDLHCIGKGKLKIGGINNFSQRVISANFGLHCIGKFFRSSI